MFGWEKLAKHHYWMTEARNTMFEHQTAGPGSAWWYCRILLPLQLINCCIGTYLSRKCSFLCCHFRLKLFSGMDLENGSLVLRVVWSCLLLSESSKKSEVVCFWLPLLIWKMFLWSYSSLKLFAFEWVLQVWSCIFECRSLSKCEKLSEGIE